MKRAALEAITAARAAGRPVVVVMPLGGEDARVWSPGDGAVVEVSVEVSDAAARALATDDAFTVETRSGRVFLLPVNPPLKLAIVGAVHIAQPLSSMAAVLGYEVTIIDPRSAFARSERWAPGVVVRTDWPDEALATMSVDHRTAVVALTHDPKIDDPALEAALRSPAFYLGALGSRKTQASRLRRLSQSGFGDDQLKRIHGPIGLPIGARSPGEIAVAILAEMTETLRGVRSGTVASAEAGSAR
jgi:xanthine dehydrogenase accessory factor